MASCLSSGGLCILDDSVTCLASLIFSPALSNTQRNRAGITVFLESACRNSKQKAQMATKWRDTILGKGIEELDHYQRLKRDTLSKGGPRWIKMWTMGLNHMHYQYSCKQRRQTVACFLWPLCPDNAIHCWTGKWQGVCFNLTGDPSHYFFGLLWQMIFSKVAAPVSPCPLHACLHYNLASILGSGEVCSLSLWI